MKYIFGPINSRRLGVSLGIDLIPFKTCSLDCVYCECGATTCRTTERKEWVKIDAVLSEIDEYLKDRPKLDYITFSGSGEPTLNSGIGRVISHLKKKYPEYKVCVLTNSTLLNREEVRMELLPADLIIPSVDAMLESSFRKMLRPDPKVKIEDILEGIRKLSDEYRGNIVIEYFLIPGINDSDEELALLRSYLLEIKPAGVQINYLARPGAITQIQIPDEARLEYVRNFLKDLPVQPVKKNGPHNGYDERIESDICELIGSGVNLEKLVHASGIRATDLMKILDSLERKNMILVEKDKTFFSLKNNMEK